MLMLAILSVGADRNPSWADTLFHPAKPAARPARSEARERARLQFDLEDAQRHAQQVENQLADLQEERTRLLGHLKQLLLERNKTRDETDRMRDDLTTVTNTLAQVAEQAARWKAAAEQWRAEADQRRGEVSELRQQLAVVPPEPPTVQKVRTTLEREVREARKDAEYVWSKERAKLERRQAAASAQLSTLTEELRQTTQQATRAQQELAEARERAQREQEQLARKAAQDEQDHQRALAQLHEQMDKAVGDLKRRLTFEHLAVRRTREDARRQINRAEQKALQERVGLEQLRSGVVGDWAKLYVRVGVLEATLGHTAEAERDFKYAVQLQPTLATAYYNLGILYDDHLNNGPAAIEAYEQYLLLAPEAKDAKTVRGWVQLLKGTETANRDRADWNRPGLGGLSKTFKELWG